MNVEIQDIRELKDMRITTFSNYKKTEVKKALIKSLNENKIEYSLHWCVEMICSGHFLDLWSIFILYSCQNIHLGNPKLFIYLAKRLESFRTIVRNGYSSNELYVRNHNEVRKIFFEICAIISQSKKKHSLQTIKVHPTDFDITTISDKFHAPSSKYAKHLIRDEDPQELLIPCNELYYHVFETKNNLMACYWCQWIIEFELICKKKKKKCLCETRSFVKVDDKHLKDCVWLVWEIFLDIADKINDKLIVTIIESLVELFMVRYSSNGANSRKMILYCAVSFLTEYVDKRIVCVSNNVLVNSCLSKINNYFQEIKKNEQKPETDYLFNNLEKKSNLDKTMAKLEIMKKM